MSVIRPGRRETTTTRRRSSLITWAAKDKKHARTSGGRAVENQSVSRRDALTGDSALAWGIGREKGSSTQSLDCGWALKRKKPCRSALPALDTSGAILTQILHSLPFFPARLPGARFERRRKGAAARGGGEGGGKWRQTNRRRQTYINSVPPARFQSLHTRELPRRGARTHSLSGAAKDVGVNEQR